MEKQRLVMYLVLGLFALALLGFVAFSEKMWFHDAPEYITIAKSFAGIDNVNLFTGHSLLYPLIISLFLKIWPSAVMIKLVNVLWLFLIALVLLFGLKEKKAFILFIFCPVIWIISLDTTPVLPASFLFLMCYIFIKREDIPHNRFYSGLFLGLSCAFYDPMIIIAPIFLLAYFWKKEISETIYYVFFAFVGFLPRLAFDSYLFHNPFYSLIRFFGNNIIVAMGLNPLTNNYMILKSPEVLWMIVLISPLLFKLYKLKLSESKEDVVFLILTSLCILIRIPMAKYFMIITPIVLLLLSKILTKKEIIIHAVVSVLIIMLMTHSYFNGNTSDYGAYGFSKPEEKPAMDDFQKILTDFNGKDIVIYPASQANGFASFIWQNSPRFIWYEDYYASLNNQSTMRSYSFKIGSNKIELRETLDFSIGFDRPANKTYENVIIVARKVTDTSKEKFILQKCYQVLCVYK